MAACAAFQVRRLCPGLFVVGRTRQPHHFGTHGIHDSMVDAPLAIHLQEVPTAPARVFAVPCWGDDGMCITGPSAAWPKPLGG